MLNWALICKRGVYFSVWYAKYINAISIKNVINFIELMPYAINI